MMLVVGDPGCCLFGSGRSQGILDLVNGGCFGGTHVSDRVYLIWLRTLVVFIFLAPLVAVKEMTHDHEDDLGGNYFVAGRLIYLYQHTCNQE